MNFRKTSRVADNATAGTKTITTMEIESVLNTLQVDH